MVDFGGSERRSHRRRPAPRKNRALTLVPPPPAALITDRAGWALRIGAAWGSVLENVLATGRTLIEAKAALSHGEFLKMIEADLPFKARAAQMLMKIAADPRLSKAQHLAHLPPSWGTLYELTKV